MRVLAVGLRLTFLCALGVTSVAAGGETATIVVKLRPADASSAEAEVELQGERVPARREAVVAMPGLAVFSDLPRDRYRVTVRSGSARAAGEAMLEGGEIVVFDLQPGVECRTPKPPADRWRLDVAASLHEARREELPSSRSIWSHLETVEPSAILDRIDGAGLHLGEPGRLSMRGASWTQNVVRLDGLDVTDPAVGGVALVHPELGALAEIRATSALASVEHPSPGVTLSLVPAEPGGRWSGSARLDWVAPGLQAGSTASGPPAVARFGSSIGGSVVAGGPVRGDRLRTLAAVSAAEASRFEGGSPDELDTRVAALLSHTVFQASARDRLRLSAFLQAVRRPFPGRARYSGGPVAERDNLVAAVTHWERPGERATWSAHAGFRTGSGQAEVEGRDADRPIERLRDGPVPDLVFAARRQRTTWEAGGQVALRARRIAGAWHVPRLGLSIGAATASDWPGAGGLTAERVDGLPARVWDYDWAGPVSRRRSRNAAAWVADALHVGDRFSAEAGLRLDWSHGSADGAPAAIDWIGLSPRVSARLRLTEAGRISLLGGYGEYRHRLLLDHLRFGDPAGPQGTVYRWDDLDGDRSFTPDERGVLVARVGPGASDGTLATIDPGLGAPRTREWVAGLEARIPGGLVVGLTGFDRRENGLLAAVNFGAPPSSYTVRLLPDPGGDIAGPQDDQMLPVYDRRSETFGQDRYLLTSPDAHRGLHQGVELRLARPLGSRFRLLLGATASRTEIEGGNRGFRVAENDQGVIGELYGNPNAGQFARGRSFFDRAYTIKMAAGWRAPGGIQLDAVARYQDGQPFGRFVVVPDLAQGPEAVPATPRGQMGGAQDDQGRSLGPSGHRFTYTLTVDARIEKSFRFKGRRIALAGEAFNLLDTRHEVEEDPVWGPSFREPVLVQPPRAFRFGAKLDF
jgi:hypothetical protein